MDSPTAWAVSASVVVLAVGMVIAMVRMMFHVETAIRLMDQSRDQFTDTLERFAEKAWGNMEIARQHSVERSARAQAGQRPEPMIPTGVMPEEAEFLNDFTAPDDHRR